MAPGAWPQSRSTAGRFRAGLSPAWAPQSALGVRDLVIGSGLEFEERGVYELKGVPGEWHLFAVAS